MPTPVPTVQSRLMRRLAARWGPARLWVLLAYFVTAPTLLGAWQRCPHHGAAHHLRAAAEPAADCHSAEPGEASAPSSDEPSPTDEACDCIAGCQPAAAVALPTPTGEVPLPPRPETAAPAIRQAHTAPVSPFVQLRWPFPVGPPPALI